MESLKIHALNGKETSTMSEANAIIQRSLQLCLDNVLWGRAAPMFKFDDFFQIKAFRRPTLDSFLAYVSTEAIQAAHNDFGVDLSESITKALAVNGSLWMKEISDYNPPLPMNNGGAQIAKNSHIILQKQNQMKELEQQNADHLKDGRIILQKQNQMKELEQQNADHLKDGRIINSDAIPMHTPSLSVGVNQQEPLLSAKILASSKNDVFGANSTHHGDEVPKKDLLSGGKSAAAVDRAKAAEIIAAAESDIGNAVAHDIHSDGPAAATSSKTSFDESKKDQKKKKNQTKNKGQNQKKQQDEHNSVLGMLALGGARQQQPGNSLVPQSKSVAIISNDTTTASRSGPQASHINPTFTHLKQFRGPSLAGVGPPAAGVGPPAAGVGPPAAGVGPPASLSAAAKKKNEKAAIDLYATICKQIEWCLNSIRNGDDPNLSFPEGYLKVMSADPWALRCFLSKVACRVRLVNTKHPPDIVIQTVVSNVHIWKRELQRCHNEVEQRIAEESGRPIRRLTVDLKPKTPEKSGNRKKKPTTCSTKQDYEEDDVSNFYTWQEDKSKPIVPKSEDILLGRGKIPFEHQGNIELRKAIIPRLERYGKLRLRADKSLMVRGIMATIMRRGGRFLKKDIGTCVDKKDYWYLAGYVHAREKIAHALRDALHNKVKCMRIEGVTDIWDKTQKGSKHVDRETRRELQQRHFDLATEPTKEAISAAIARQGVKEAEWASTTRVPSPSPAPLPVPFSNKAMPPSIQINPTSGMASNNPLHLPKPIPPCKPTPPPQPMTPIQQPKELLAIVPQKRSIEAEQVAFATCEERFSQLLLDTKNAAVFAKSSVRVQACLSEILRRVDFMTIPFIKAYNVLGLLEIAKPLCSGSLFRKTQNAVKKQLTTHCHLVPDNFKPIMSNSQRKRPATNQPIPQKGTKILKGVSASSISSPLIKDFLNMQHTMGNAATTPKSITNSPSLPTWREASVPDNIQRSKVSEPRKAGTDSNSPETTSPTKQDAAQQTSSGKDVSDKIVQVRANSIQLKKAVIDLGDGKLSKSPLVTNEKPTEVRMKRSKESRVSEVLLATKEDNTRRDSLKTIVPTEIRVGPEEAKSSEAPLARKQDAEQVRAKEAVPRGVKVAAKRSKPFESVLARRKHESRRSSSSITSQQVTIIQIGQAEANEADDTNEIPDGCASMNPLAASLCSKHKNIGHCFVELDDSKLEVDDSSSQGTALSDESCATDDDVGSDCGDDDDDEVSKLAIAEELEQSAFAFCETNCLPLMSSCTDAVVVRNPAQVKYCLHEIKARIAIMSASFMDEYGLFKLLLTTKSFDVSLYRSVLRNAKEQHRRSKGMAPEGFQPAKRKMA